MPHVEYHTYFPKPESNHVFYTKVFNKDKNETEQIERHISFECDYISGRQIYDPS